MPTSNWKRAATVGDDALKNDPAGWLNLLQNSNNRQLNQARSRVIGYTVDQNLLVEVQHG